MKKKILCLLPLLLIPFLSSCADDEKVALTYGTYAKQTIYTINEITTAQLASKAKDEKEVFLLAVYQGEYSQDCLCWTTFQNVIASYMNAYHDLVYTYNAYEQDDSVKSLKIDKYTNSTPCLYVFNGEKNLAKYSYQNQQDKIIFEDVTGEAMSKRLQHVIDKPTLYYVDEEYLDQQYLTAKKICVLFFRNGCGDCQYVLPNVLIPYIKEHKLATEICMFDMQKYYDQSKSESATDEQKGKYQFLKNRFGLSEIGDTVFGYGNGVVPTIQFVENGKVDGATIYFNDVISQKEDGSFYVSDSFYSEERLPNLKYLKGMSKQIAVLKGKTIKDGVLESPYGYYWSQEAASKYHKPLLEAFLDYYMF